MIYLIGLGIWAAFLAFAWSLGIVAGRADERVEALHKQQEER